MSGVNVQRTSYDHTINLLLVEQTAVVIVGLDVRNHGFRFGEAARIDVGHCDQVDIRYGDNLFQQLAAPPADTNHADSYTVVGAEHTPVGESGQGQRRAGAAGQELPPADGVGHGGTSGGEDVGPGRPPGRAVIIPPRGA